MADDSTSSPSDTGGTLLLPVVTSGDQICTSRQRRNPGGFQHKAGITPLNESLLGRLQKLFTPFTPYLYWVSHLEPFTSLAIPTL